MARAVVLLLAAVAAAILVAACDAVPKRVEVGQLRTESRSVDAKNAESVRANLRLAVGKLNVGGGAANGRLMEGDFAYNVAAWRPGVDYEVVGDSGELTVQQRGLTEGVPTRDVRNEWSVRLSDDVPVDLTVRMGGGVGNLDLDNLALTGLNLDVGAGSTRVDLSGDWGRDLSAVVRGGAGEVTVLLPSRKGVKVVAGTRFGRINAEGLKKAGEAYVNDAYGDSEATLKVIVTGGVGQINLEVVQGQGGAQQGATRQEETTGQETTRQGGGDTTTGRQGGTTMMQKSTEGTAQEGTTTVMPEGTTAGRQGAVEPPAILEDPQRYYGRTTTVGGAVGQVIEPRAFVMVDEQTTQGGPPSGAELAEGGVLVVRTGGPPTEVAELQTVRATGTLQEFDLTAFEQQQGVDLDDELYSEYQDRPVLVAGRVETMRGEATAP